MKQILIRANVFYVAVAYALVISTLWGAGRPGWAQASKNARPQTDLVIIDTDIGDDIDDAMAVGLALASPELKVIAINSAWGDTSLRARLIDRLLTAVGRRDIAIGQGVVKHKKGEAVFSQARWAMREPPHAYSNAVDLLLKSISEHPRQITLVAIGPLTNLAAAYDRDPATFKLLKRIVTMGGSVRLGYDEFGYSLPSSPSAEYNIVMDIEAAKKVYTSGVPIFMMPLDSTQIKIDELKREQLFTQSTPYTDALALLYLQWSRFTKQQTPTAFDVMAVAYAIDPGLCPTTPIHVRIDDLGYTREEPGVPNVSACLRSDSDAFFQFFMPRILAYGDTEDRSGGHEPVSQR